MKVYIITGKSGAGKDTTFGLLAKQGCFYNVKFSHPMKEMMAYAYSVGIDQLENKQRRLDLVPGTDFTYADLMVRCYHNFPNIDPHMMVRKVINIAKNRLTDGYDLVFTDVRNMVEVDTIMGLGVSVVHISLLSDAEPLTSDCCLFDIRQKLKNTEGVVNHTIDNRDQSCIENLEVQLREII